MKKVKVLSLCMVVMLSSASLFAQTPQSPQKDRSQVRSERMISDLNLNEKQAKELKEIENSFSTKMKADRENAKADREKMRQEMTKMRTEKDAQIKKILTDEQYQKYQSLSKQKNNKKGNHAKDGRKGKSDKKGSCCSKS